MPSRRDLLASAALATTGVLAGCTDGQPSSTPTGTPTGTPTSRDGSSSFDDPILTSAAFEDGEPIPQEHTCSGAGRSPPLAVSEVPEETETFAMVMDDPDVGSRPYVHWLVWDVPVERTEWPADIPEGETVEALDGATQGTNSRGTVGYVGPCPPPGDGPHTYRFTLYALGSSLGLDSGSERSAVESAIAGTESGVTTLRGTFER